jgi:signal transduction histidine kinase
MLVTALAVVLFAVPLAIAASQLYRDEAVGRLSAEASRAAGILSGDALRPGADVDRPLALPAPRRPETELAVYDAAGRRLFGTGPDRSRLAVSVAADRDEEQDHSGGELAVAVPVRMADQDVVVRAASPYGRVQQRTWITVGLMTGLALVVLGLAALLARRRAARIAAPLEQLTLAAHALGEGNFTVTVPTAGVYEAAEAGRALNATAGRLGELLHRARSAGQDASHQVRTPLTALRLGLERTLLDPAADRDAAIRQALDRAGQVEATVEEVLARARDPLAPVEPTDLADVVSSARAGRWAELARAGGRAVRLDVEADLPPARATPAVLHQVLDVLVTNALGHGAGPVTVTVRSAGDGLAVDVSDEGAGFDPATLPAALRRGNPHARGTGIGLGLARELAESIGGRLVIVEPGPRPVIRLLLGAYFDGA